MTKNAARRLALALFGLFPLAVDAEELQVTPPATRAFIVDGAGRRLGALIGPTRVLVSLPKGEAVLGVGPNGYQSVSAVYPTTLFPNAFTFRSSDCTGEYFPVPAQIPTAAFYDTGGKPPPGRTPDGGILYASRNFTRTAIGSFISLTTEDPCVATSRSAPVSALEASFTPSMRLPISIDIQTIAEPAPAPAATSGVGVYDARNAYVGNVVDQDAIWMKLSDGEALLSVAPTGAFAPAPATLYYTQAGCAGQAYMAAEGLPAKAAFIPGDADARVVSKGVVRYPIRPYETIDAVSSLSTDTRQCVAQSTPRLLAGKAGVLRLSGYRLPFSVR